MKAVAGFTFLSVFVSSAIRNRFWITAPAVDLAGVGRNCLKPGGRLMGVVICKM